MVFTVSMAAEVLAVAVAVLSEVGLAGIEAGLKESVVSPLLPITATLTSTGTSAPSLKNTSRSIPSSGDSRSKEALSVSYENRISPTDTDSPFFLNHLVMMHVSTD